MTDINQATVDRLVVLAGQLGPFALPLIRAAQSGRLDLLIATRAMRAPLAEMRRGARPVVLWIGDDDYASTGPEEWRCAHAAADWARAAIVHSAGGKAEHYAEAVRAAGIVRRFLLVETSTAHALAWTALLPRKPVLLIRPYAGHHPVAPAAGDVH